MAYNRELSQLAPFIYVDEYLRNIGIGSTGLPHVGMGTTVPIGKLDVRGHSHFTNVAVSTGATIANLSVTGVTTTFNFEATGISTFAGITTVTSQSFFTQQISVAGVATFNNTTDNTLGDADTGAVQIDGGLGVNKNVTVGAGLSVVSGFDVAGLSTFQGDVRITDNDKLRFGTSSGGILQVFTNGTNSFFKQTSGDLKYELADQFIVQKDSGDEPIAVFTADGSVELYYDNSKKFETVGLGATIYGTLFTDQLSVAGVSTFVGVTTFSGANVFISNDLFVGGLKVTGGITTIGDDITTRNLEVTGLSTFHGEMNALGNVGLGTTNPLNTLQVGLGNSSLTVVSTTSTTMVGVGTTNPQRTFDMKGDGNVEGSFNVDGSLSVNQSAVATIGLVIALGG